MSISFQLNSKSFHVLILCSSIVLCFLPGIVSSAEVTLHAIEIFKTHEWINSKPTVYFNCQGENKTTILPDVSETHVLYNFKGEESWQPLTELDKKCKRCGLYEKDTIEKDDTFDEWEFCPKDFVLPDGKYIRFKTQEFNATFFCPECISLGSKGVYTNNGMHVFWVVLITALVSGLCIFAAVVGYRYWQRKKRERDQARFLKLFEDDDEIEEELGLGPVL